MSLEVDLAKLISYARDMIQVNVHEAKSQLSKLLEMVEGGESVVIARNGQPVVELIPAKKKPGFPFGIARGRPLFRAGDEWWKPMTDEEADRWIDGK